MNASDRGLRYVLAAVTVVGLLTTDASAQIVIQPGTTLPRQPRGSGIVIQPSVNTWPGIPASMLNQPVFTPPFYNPALNNPWMNPVTITPVNPFVPPTAVVRPPVALQQPGTMLVRGPDLQVNPWSGTVYRPLSGTVTLADGSTFYRVPGSGLPTVTGAYATGTGLYDNPLGGTFFNPSSGVVSQPGSTNLLIPYVW
jgi:hypothetical protein